MTGTINVSDHTVWVNGVKATIDSGTWQADNVPMTPGGTAVIQARAIPNTDHDGNGTGGSGGTVATMQDPGIPNSAQAKDTGIEPEQSFRLYVERDWPCLDLVDKGWVIV
jgi:hypothetical protein